MNGDPATAWLYGAVIAAWALLTAWPGEQGMVPLACSMARAFGWQRLTLPAAPPPSPEQHPAATIRRLPKLCRQRSATWSMHSTGERACAAAHAACASRGTAQAA